LSLPHCLTVVKVLTKKMKPRLLFTAFAAIVTYTSIPAGVSAVPGQTIAEFTTWAGTALVRRDGTGEGFAFLRALYGPAIANPYECHE
jgi:hypothetical protein